MTSSWECHNSCHAPTSNRCPNNIISTHVYLPMITRHWLTLNTTMPNLGVWLHVALYCCQNVNPSTGYIKTLRPRQNDRHFPENIFKCIFLNENDRIPTQISLKFVPRSPTDNKPALVQVMAWHQTGNKTLPEPMMTPMTDAYMRHSASMS